MLSVSEHQSAVLGEEAGGVLAGFFVCAFWTRLTGRSVAGARAGPPGVSRLIALLRVDRDTTGRAGAFVDEGTSAGAGACARTGTSVVVGVRLS